MIEGYPELTNSNGWTLLVGYGTAPSFNGENSGRLRLEIYAPALWGMAWFDRAYVGQDSQTDSPVCVVRNFTASPGQGQVSLTWTNPPGDPYSSFTGTTVRCRTDRYPVTPTDGTLVGEVSGSPGGTSSVVHTGLTAGVRYYYGAFAHTSGNLNYSKGSYTSALTTDSTPPTTPLVTDDGAYTRSDDTLHASWTSSDPESGIAEYQYAIGTSGNATGVANWTSVGTNTSVTKSGLSLQNGTVYYFSVKARNGVGLWSNVGSSDGIRVMAEAETIGDAKLLPDGTFVWLESKTVSAGNSDFPGLLYVQEADRSSGIRVNGTSIAATGDEVDIGGVMSGGALERLISPALISYQSTGEAPKPLSMPQRSLLGGDLSFDPGPPASGQNGLAPGFGPNNVGLLVTVWGVVTQMGGDYFYIEDGSAILDGTQTDTEDNRGVRVRWNPAGYSAGDLLMVTGISSCFEAQPGVLARLVLPRKASDVIKVSP
jgi:hypothetical protein